MKNGQSITIDLHDSLLVPALNGTTLVSDQSLLKLNFVITLGQNDIHMNLGKQHIALSRTKNGIITFPTQTSKQIVTSSKPQCNNTSLFDPLQSSDITTPSHGKIKPNHGEIAPNHDTIAPSHESLVPNHGKIDKHKQKSISLSLERLKMKPSSLISMIVITLIKDRKQ